MPFRKEKEVKTNQPLENKIEETKEEEKLDKNQENISQEDFSIEEEIDVEVEEVEEEHKESDEEVEIKKEINKKREEFNLIQKKNKRKGMIIFGFILVFLVASFVLLLTLTNEDNSWISYVFLGITVFLLVIGYIFQRIEKKNATEAANTYLNFLLEQTDKFIYSDEKFSNFSLVPTDPNSEICKGLFLDRRMYKDIKYVRGRNIVYVDYKESKLTSLDVAGSVVIKGRPSPRFLGKLYVYPYKGKEEDRCLFQLKGKELSCPVDDIDDLTIIEGNDKYVYYVDKEENKSLISSKAISLIKSIKIDKDVIDVIVTVNKGFVGVGIDYSDEFEAIAIDKDFKLDNTYKTKKDLNKVLQIIDEINKK